MARYVEFFIYLKLMEKPDYKEKICLYCDKPFKPTSAHQMYHRECSVKIRKEKQKHTHKLNRDKNYIKTGFKEKTCFNCGSLYIPTGSQQKYCTICGPKIKEELEQKYKKNWYLENKIYLQEINAKYYQEHKEHIKQQQVEYNKKNQEKQIKYRKNNRAVARKRQNIYIQERRKYDLWFALYLNIRSNFKLYLKNNNISKFKSTIEYIGCTSEELKKHLESKFEPWMNWENYGKYKSKTFNYGWDVDHIKPLSSAKTEDDIYKLWHYTNLQPLCSYINRYKKSNKLDFNLEEFKKTNAEYILATTNI